MVYVCTTPCGVVQTANLDISSCLSAMYTRLRVCHMARIGHREMDVVWLWWADGDVEPCPVAQDNRKRLKKTT